LITYEVLDVPELIIGNPPRKKQIRKEKPFYKEKVDVSLEILFKIKQVILVKMI